jgi:hypothetical protein
LIPYLSINALVFLVIGLAAGFCLLKNKLAHGCALIASTAVIFLLVISASSGALNQKTIKPLALQIKPIMQPSDEVVAYFKYYQDIPIYLERRVTIVADWNASDIPQRDNWVRELWYGMPFQDTKNWLISDDTFWQRWNGDKRLFVFTDNSYYESIKKNSKIKVHFLGQYNRAVLISNKPN